MLNNDDATVRELAHESLFLHLKRRKVPAALCGEPQFLRFRPLKSNGKLDIRTAGFGVRSDWLDLNDLCQRTGLQLSWQRADGAAVAQDERIITDPQVSTRVLLSTQTPLSIKYVKASLLHLRRTQNAQHWTSLKLQGKLALLQAADHSIFYLDVAGNNKARTAFGFFMDGVAKHGWPSRIFKNHYKRGTKHKRTPQQPVFQLP
ncbi:hypothetical protein QQF64_033953 [Cirrhinus molitorella]|uniref:Uncharacterized protein n=1 Tax=Cirrhinus molitorella TaxID=172907 RepID=A0ABR3MVE2_9TELE